MYEGDINKLHVEAIIREANLFFNRGEYEKAAKKYENAAELAQNELQDAVLAHEAHRLAINSWILTDKAENASDIIESLPQDDRIPILKEIVNKVLKKADFLIKNKEYKSTIELLNVFIKLYHLNDLNSELQMLNEKQLKVVKLMTKSSRIFKKSLIKKK